MIFETQLLIYDNEIKELRQLLYFTATFGLKDEDVTAEIKKKLGVVQLKRRRLFREKIIMVDYLDKKK